MILFFWVFIVFMVFMVFRRIDDEDLKTMKTPKTNYSLCSLMAKPPPDAMLMRSLLVGVTRRTVRR